MNELNEKSVIGDLVLSEGRNYYSRDTVTIVSGAGILPLGSVLGKRTKTTVTVEPDEGNTGNGTISAVTLGPLAEPGVYLLELIAEEENGGVFAVTTPSGYRLADALVGIAYAGNHLNFTVSDGATDFDVGDKFTVEISGDGKFDFAKVGNLTGLARAEVVLLQEVDATDADVADALVCARQAIVSEQGLTFHSSADNESKRSALKADLLRNGIRTTQGA